jgi:hypothetical protein
VFPAHRDLQASPALPGLQVKADLQVSPGLRVLPVLPDLRVLPGLPDLQVLPGLPDLQVLPGLQVTATHHASNQAVVSTLCHMCYNPIQ